MTAVRTRRWLLGMPVLIVLIGPTAGCRLFNKESGGAGPSTDGRLTGRRDPLFGGDRIPATKLPTGRDGQANGRRDPLLTSSGGEETRDLPSRKEPFRTGPETTNAGLTVAGGTDDSTDRRATGATTGRRVMVSDDAMRELKRLNVRVQDPERVGDEYIARGEMEAPTGERKRFEGAGPTPAAALTELLDQIAPNRRD